MKCKDCKCDTNKYQEDFDFLEVSIDHCYFKGSHTTIDRIHRSLDSLKELVKRETPKPIIIDDTQAESHGWRNYCCPTCDTVLGDDNFDWYLSFSYCPECGQRLEI